MAQHRQQSQKGHQQQQPTGTSGRQSGDTHSGSSANDARRTDTPPAGRNRTFDEDEGSLLGNRTTNR